MKIIRGISRIPKFKGSAVCLGVFDGVHLGHQKIIQKAIARAQWLGVPSVAVTMDPHPSRILKPGRPRTLLYSLDQRLRRLADMGLDYCLVIHFTQGFSRMPAEEFIKGILLRRLQARAICVGEDFRFGHGALGSVELLRRSLKKRGVEVHAIRSVRARGKVISSTRIRQLMLKGDLDLAAQLTGRPLSLVGAVVHGKGRGRKLGYPTVNLKLHHETHPPAGVYAVWAQEGRTGYPGALHLGPRPTFGEEGFQAEAHLLSVHKSLYGKEMELFLVQKIRNVRRFMSPEELKKQIKKDLVRIKQVLRRNPVPLQRNLHRV